MQANMELSGALPTGIIPPPFYMGEFLPMKRFGMIVLAAVAAFCSAGCDGTGEYNSRNIFPAAALTPRSEWAAFSSAEVSNIEAAIDGSDGTAAETGYDYKDASVIIDLGKACMFNEVIVSHDPHEMGYAHRVAVLTSMDGKTFRKCFDGPGNRKVSYFLLVAPVLARYVKLQVVYPGAEPWSLGEIYLR